MKVGQHVQLQVEMYDEDADYGYNSPLLVKGEIFEIVAISERFDIIGAIKLMHVNSGVVLDIEDEYGYWCFLTSARPSEYKIVEDLSDEK